MACWSAENATKAYIRSLKMSKRGKEPDVAEFISALAAGNNAQLMVMAPSASAMDRSMMLSLVAAAHQTGGRVVSISRDHQELQMYRSSLGLYSQYVEFLIGDTSTLLVNDLKDADFVLIDCKSNGYELIFRAAKESVKGNEGALIVGYNALPMGTSTLQSNGLKTHFLPIGEGLMVSRSAKDSKVHRSQHCNLNKKSSWVVKVDEITGEEHVFRIVSPRTRQMIHA